jgi:hypothetical protein
LADIPRSGPSTANMAAFAWLLFPPASYIGQDVADTPSSVITEQ